MKEMTREHKIYRDYLMKHFIDCNYDIQATIIWVKNHFQEMQQYEYNVYSAYRLLNKYQRNQIIKELIIVSEVGSEQDATKHKYHV